MALKIKTRGKGLFVSALLALVTLTFSPGVARACDPCPCVPLYHTGDPGGSVTFQYPIPEGFSPGSFGSPTSIRGVIREQHELTTRHIVEEFNDLEEFLVDVTNPLNPDTIFGRYILPAWMMMTEQLVHSAMYQMFALGTIFDAKLQIETQQLFQELEAEAYKDYQSSHSMCVIGTNVRSLAAAERNAELATFVLSQRGIDRQMGNMRTAAARGNFDDHCMRLRQFRQRYCNLKDNNNHMLWMCDPEEAAAQANTTFTPFRRECLPGDVNITLESMNKDISFARTIDKANTLEIDFLEPAEEPSDDEQDIFALASNLYSHDVVFRIPETALRQRNTQDELLDMRSVVAKRAVAENSFNTIVGMKAMGTEKSTVDTMPYMRLLLKSLDIGDDGEFAADELRIFLGDRPSYDAQMEVMTKRIFQSPDFYVNLYDEPTNVERKGVALQAIALMQEFDTWNSYLRTEAMLSVVLELELLRLNSAVENQMGSMRSGGFEW